MRPATFDDVPAIGALVRRAERHDGVPRVLADEELAQDLEADHLDLGEDTRVVEGENGEIVGWSYIWHPSASDRLDRAELHGEVAPEHRGRGIGRQLLGWGVARARLGQALRDHDLPRHIRVVAYDWLEDRHRLFARFGFEAVRWNDTLYRALDDLPEVRVPDGYVLEPWPDDRDEELRAVRNAAFADHWGSTMVEPGSWAEFLRGHGSRPDLSVVVVDTGTGAVVGVCINQYYPEDEAVTARRDGWIANVGTVRDARGRGLASSMLQWSMHAFAAAGLSHAILDVDTDNPTGTARLYRNLGFEPLHRSITFEIQPS